MKIFPLGVGGAFTKSNYHNNYIIELDNKFLLIDAGTTLRNSLPAAGFNYFAIDTFVPFGCTICTELSAETSKPCTFLLTPATV